MEIGAVEFTGICGAKCAASQSPHQHDAQSGRSETVNETLALNDGGAVGVQYGSNYVQLTADEQLEPENQQLSPLPPPSPSDGPEAAAEYETYLQRWDTGDTLAQRWHRLTQNGRLEEVRADWEDWQLDLMLQQVKQKTAAALRDQGRADRGNYLGGGICSTRLRRGRGEVQEADDSPDEAPSRRVRSRRAPSTLQDYHVDANKTPDTTPEAVAAGAGSCQPGAFRQQLMPAGQLVPPVAAADAASEESTDEAADDVTARALQQQQRQQSAAEQKQQQQAPHRAGGRRGPLPQQPPKRVVTKVQRTPAAHQQQQQHQPTRPFNRVITPYNPQLHQQQQQLEQHMHSHHVMQAMQQHEQQQVAAAAALAGVSPEMLEEFYQMGSRLGAAFGQGEGDTASLATGLASNPAAMAAFMHVCCQYGVNPSAVSQQAAAMIGHPQ